MDLNPTEPAGAAPPGAPSAEAPWSRIHFGEPAEWVEAEPYERDVPAKEGAHFTHLLWCRQAHGPSGRSYHGTATRMESAIGVQQHSQWRMVIDARFQDLTLHWLRVRRGDSCTDHLARDRMRLIQRETQLEHHVLNGCWTLLVVIDDVRPGDVIEAAYTFESRFPLSVGWCEAFFSIPPFVVVGRYHLGVRFAQDNPSMRWKASEGVPAPGVRTLGGLCAWDWEGSQLAPREPEANVPSSHFDFTSIQVGDIPGWSDLSARLDEAWSSAGTPPDPALDPALAMPAVVDAAAVAGLIRHIQDGYRYLSVDLPTGGWVPASPAEVVRRRYGDCKDLAWLACSVLRSWGVRARPILVGTLVAEGVGTVIPSAQFLNHAVLEASVGGSSRWFDLTLRCQGGGFETVPIGWFGFGLAVDRGAGALAVQRRWTGPNLYAVRETFRLDSRKGRPIVVEIRHWAEGYQAENLRRVRQAQGPETMAKERLKLAQKRYGKAERIGGLQWADDRGRNVCNMVEVFEVSDALQASENGRMTYTLPRSMVGEMCFLPEDKPRRCPWKMQMPLEIRHAVTVVQRTMGRHPLRQRRWTADAFVGTCEEVYFKGEWSRVVTMRVTADQVPADRVAEHRRVLADFLRAASWRLFLPAGKAADPEPQAGFGAIPPPSRGVAAYAAPADADAFAEARIGEETPPVGPPPFKRFLATHELQMRAFVFIAWIGVIIALGAMGNCSAPK